MIRFVILLAFNNCQIFCEYMKFEDWFKIILQGLEKMQPTIGMITNDRKSAGRSIKDLIAEARNLLDKLDDAFDGMVDDNVFLDGWFAVRKIKGGINPKINPHRKRLPNNP